VTAADEQAVDLLREILAIDSPSGHEADLAAAIERRAPSLGLRARRDAAGNVIAEAVHGDGPTVLLMSHLDTACCALPVRVDGGRIHGRGAVDAKGPLAAMLAAAARPTKFRGRVVVAGVVEEETPGSRGANHLVATLARPDAIVVGEPSGWADVVLGYKGQLALTYAVKRPSTHPTNPCEKASEAAAAFWTDVARAAFDRTAADRAAGAPPSAFHELTATLLRVAGDMVEASLAIDLRLPPGFDPAPFVAALEGCARGGDVRVEHWIPAVKTDRRDPVVRALTAAIRARGGTPGHKLKTATSDMNTVAPRWRVPMATYGPGDSSLDHSDDEHIEIDHYLRAIDVLSTAIADLAVQR